jgi:predicted glycoside hydrolase/deacetylase ChbG (UPF0249 family)
MKLAGARLIINADDFGYFARVSDGIVDVAERGLVTATGVMANAPALGAAADRLKSIPALSIGVHLNGTLGSPLTPQMRQALRPTHGLFPSKMALVSALLFGRLSVDTLLGEWRAQIQHVLRLGIPLTFVNSHEHVHMLPLLFQRVNELAGEFGLHHVRRPHAEPPDNRSLASAVRCGAFATLQWLLPAAPHGSPRLLGLGPSGRLNLDYLRRAIPRLDPGRVYELMCHPGWYDPAVQQHPSLARYHDWEGEMLALKSPEFTSLLADHGIRLISFKDLPA